ncbi:MBL fold metallo-hydrolase [Gemmatimonadota bacterium]
MSRSLRIIRTGLLCLLPWVCLPGSAAGQQAGDVAPSDATIWYLGHCGYAIQTENHLLIFDYIELEEDVPARMGLDRGFIDASQLKDLNVTVFVTHEHSDHFDEVILGWQEEIESIEYVFGWQAMDGPGYHNLPPPRKVLNLGDMWIWTVNSHHSGVPEAAFLVQVDGLTIYHGGDYQGRMGRNAPSNVDADMASLNEITDEVDLLFIGAWTGEPYMKTIRALNPRAIFPMHSRNREEEYRQFATDLAELGVEVPVHCPAKRGDSFVFDGGALY